jgi:hypothetical protein
MQQAHGLCEPPISLANDFRRHLKREERISINLQKALMPSCVDAIQTTLFSIYLDA